MPQILPLKLMLPYKKITVLLPVQFQGIARKTPVQPRNRRQK